MSPRADRSPFWRRWLLWPALGLAVLNVGAFLAYTLPRRLQERTLAARAVTLRQEVARERGVNEGLRRQAQAIGANTQDAHRFLTQVVSGRESLSATLEDLERTARQAGLSMERRTYSRAEIEPLALVRFEVTLPLAGSYRQLMDFLDALERSPRFLTVDRVLYKDRTGESPDLSVIVSAYFAKEAEHGG